MVLGLPGQVCMWFSLTRLPTESARKLFLYHFLKETALSFVLRLLEPVQCLGKTFCVPNLFPSHVKYYPNSQSCICPVIDHRQEPIKITWVII